MKNNLRINTFPLESKKKNHRTCRQNRTHGIKKKKKIIIIAHPMHAYKAHIIV